MKLTSQICSSTSRIPTHWPAKTLLRLILRLPMQMRPQRVTRSVRYADSRVRITMQLIDGATGSHLWSEAYEREFKDVFAIQADIAMNVANALNATFTPEEQRQIERTPNVSTDTYALLLQFYDLVASGNQSARTLAMLDQMIAKDPEYSLPSRFAFSGKIGAEFHAVLTAR